MFACHYAQANAKKKGVGLHYSSFQKTAPSLPTSYEVKTFKNRHSRGRIAEVGLKAFRNRWRTAPQRFSLHCR
jgi:hypothetical protein